nr:MGMT family protein [Isorropodon fossajaponicum symbiont]
MSVIIPCHRIIGSNGELVGYGGELSIKKRLLNLEKKITIQDESFPNDMQIDCVFYSI